MKNWNGERGRRRRKEKRNNMIPGRINREKENINENEDYVVW
tara:strand:+ start:261 stop:386 length:126 start_codon:yes stop_codon:yes gene_type:complete